MNDLSSWVQSVTGHSPRDAALFQRALTHSSRGGDDYERLEFLGDRVLGLAVADWLIETFPDDHEGKLSDRLHALVAGDVCAEVARELGASSHIRLGQQALNDGVFDNDNVLGDVVEALIGALYLEAGFAAASAFVRRAWNDRVTRLSRAPKHPKAELQEWAAANNRKPPVYEVTERSGPEHAPVFTVRVSVRGAGDASAQGTSKQEAETEAARLLLEQIG